MVQTFARRCVALALWRLGDPTDCSGESDQRGADQHHRGFIAHATGRYRDPLDGNRCLCLGFIIRIRPRRELRRGLQPEAGRRERLDPAVNALGKTLGQLRS